ncbi:hypothetical protein [Amycolatopsis sp. NPDC051371]|uniref:hypothetical protein n=1 Tax=Amycolatopsis sp. NPDC051371 TaxID=3155800 RepID=UPI00343280AE
MTLGRSSRHDDLLARQLAPHHGQSSARQHAANPSRGDLRSTAVAIMIRLLERRRERRRIAVIQARHALVSLPNVRWHDRDSEHHARTRLQDIAATVDRALPRLHSASDHALALKYAHARLTAFLQGWDDAELLTPIDLPEMYQSLVSALHTLALRLEAEENRCRHVPPANPSSTVTPPSSPARTADAHTSLLSGPRASTASGCQSHGGRGAPATPITNQPGDHGQLVSLAAYLRSRSADSFRGRIR